MFDDLVPREMREVLRHCSDIRHSLASLAGWATFEPSDLDEAIARMEHTIPRVLTAYRARQLSLDEAVRQLADVFEIPELLPLPRRPGAE